MTKLLLNLSRSCFGIFALLMLAASPAVTAQSKTTVETEVTVTTEQLHGSQDSQLATSSDQQIATIPTSRTPEEAFDDWLDEVGIDDGVNSKDDGTMFVVVYGEATVNAKGDPKKPKNRWVQARNAAYSTAVMLAKAEIADLVSAEVQSERSSSVMDMGGDNPPPMMAEPAKQLSVMDKALTLTGKALDHQIKQFDPEWDGSGMSDEQRKERLVGMRETFKESMGQLSRLFITGAMPVINLEGNDEEGNYVVGVGLIWSPKTQAVAQGIIDDDVTLPIDEPEPKIRDQIKQALNDDPNFMAVSSGVRVWTNEKGEQTVVAFVGLDRTKSKQKNKRESGMRGRVMIAQFVAEQTEASDQAETEMVTDQLMDDSSETFNASTFESTVKAKSKKLRLTGVARVYKWKGKHPVSKAKMLVDVWAWTPSGRKQAAQIAEAAEKAEKKMNKKAAAGSSATTSSGSGGSAGSDNTTTTVPASGSKKGATTKKKKW